jgi:HlyD family secretion protein
MKKLTFIVLAASFAALSCGRKTTEADAYGSFEATEVIVSAETAGRILSYDPEEGSTVSKGQTIALIDTTLLVLQKAELEAGINGIKTKLTSINAQNEILRQQISNVEVNINRTEKMLKDDAATYKQMDDLTGQVAVLRKQIDANNSQKASVDAEMKVYESKRATLDEQIARSRVKSPIDGTLIEKYSEAGEMTAAGKPLAKIADLSVMKLKVYVSGTELEKIRTGQECTVRTDKGKNDYNNLTGTISYISEKAEFTPKIIQTKKERVTLVYAVTIDVKNDGSIKSGMPGEAIF